MIYIFPCEWVGSWENICVVSICKPLCMICVVWFPVFCLWRNAYHVFWQQNINKACPKLMLACSHTSKHPESVAKEGDCTPWACLVDDAEWPNTRHSLPLYGRELEFKECVCGLLLTDTFVEYQRRKKSYAVPLSKDKDRSPLCGGSRMYHTVRKWSSW